MQDTCWKELLSIPCGYCHMNEAAPRQFLLIGSLTKPFGVKCCLSVLFSGFDCVTIRYQVIFWETDL